MPAVRFRKQSLDVPLADVAGISLVKSDLQLLPQLVLHELMKLVARHDDVDTLRLIILDFDRTAVRLPDRLPLFF